ncbi:anthranilate synthase alpha subunit 1, chloroplastic isoform X1 [Vitis vinifera]|uniref:anthranilate synthase alpha subunit 1, chloroplastic isoform X1 n=1 Tax=Vitis vinifera TaxID=29760 RepID=UPI0008FECA39|nr:anthranilate synthase alpha subunit 1, chloroplastic isoform X1 [Vitis vinifera]|eukprot:XP_019079487.1 PREDICTED: anthranilate synthase alpha subunit 1, chloroplastic isoform X1 [Vitis vinifera]
METLAVSYRSMPFSDRISHVLLAGVSTRSSVSVPCQRAFKCLSLAAPSLVKDNPVKFKEASRNGNIVPLHACIFSDQLTPILAYRCLVKEGDLEAPSFVFESVVPGSQDSSVGRYSVVGAQPCMEIVAKENKVITMDHEEGLRTEELVEDPMVIPRRIAEGWKPQLLDELPDTFCGGWVGFFSYDTVCYVEKKKLPFSKAQDDDRNLADIHLALYDDVIVFDHVEKKVHVIHWVRLDLHSSVEKAYVDGMKRLEILLSRVQDIDPPKLSPGCVESHIQSFSSSLNESNMTSEAYKKAKEHIRAGDIFQIGLSQCFERRTFADPFEVYRAFRVVNPSPFMAYLQVCVCSSTNTLLYYFYMYFFSSSGFVIFYIYLLFLNQARGCVLVASSPEILTHVKKNNIVNRPLAGTVRRGTTIHEDEMLEGQLLNDEKQCAEHIMLVDLGRNNVGKVAKFGSLKVEDLKAVECFSHVMHISSTVTGELQDHLTSWNALRSILHVGAVSGAPKVKAMELIDEWEESRRGPYGGGFGNVSFTGDMEIDLTLRTIVFPTGNRYDTLFSYKDTKLRREWVAYFQAGAGIVADSVVDDKQRDCEGKAAALACAIDLAEAAFVKK